MSTICFHFSLAFKGRPSTSSVPNQDANANSDAEAIYQEIEYGKCLYADADAEFSSGIRNLV